MAGIDVIEEIGIVTLRKFIAAHLRYRSTDLRCLLFNDLLFLPISTIESRVS